MKIRTFTLLLLGATLFTISMVSCKKKKKNKTGTFVDDRDGKQYGWIELGEQTWMLENLAYTGDNGYQVQKTFTEGNESEWLTDSLNGWCYYDDDVTNMDTYGVLYQRNAARQASPEGWHLPTHYEFNRILFFF